MYNLPGQDNNQQSISKRVGHWVMLVVVFILFMGVVLLGVQWFSTSLGQFFFGKSFDSKSAFSASLEAIASVAKDEPGQQSGPPGETLPAGWQNEELNLQAGSAVAVEVGDTGPKVLFSQNEVKQLPIASLTKLMTALVVLEKYDLNQQVTISDQAMAQEGVQGILQQGQVLTVKNLLYISLIESSNRAAYALSEVMGKDAFVAAMNSKAKDLGLANTHFEDPTGLDEKSYSSAQDIATLSAYLYWHYPLFGEITGLQKYDLYLPDGSLHHTLANTNELLGKVPGIVGGKTGFTTQAQGCVMAIQESPTKGNKIIYVVLGAQDRFAEMEKMIEWVHWAY